MIITFSIEAVGRKKKKENGICFCFVDCFSREKKSVGWRVMDRRVRCSGLRIRGVNDDFFSRKPLALFRRMTDVGRRKPS